MMRTLQLLSIAGILFGSANAQDLKGYIGLKLKTAKSYLTLGEDADIKFYRAGNGVLKLVAPSIDFLTDSVTTNGQPIKTGGAPSGGNNQDTTGLNARLAKLEKSGLPKGPKPNPNAQACTPTMGYASVRAWNTGTKHHDVDLTRAYNQFPLDASKLADNDISSQSGYKVDANIFWYFAVKFTSPCPSATFNFELTGTLHHFRTAYSTDGKKWICASNYIGHDNKKKSFTGCKGGNAYKYHGRRGTISFTKTARYYAFGFRDAGVVSNLAMKCNGANVGKGKNKYRTAKNQCADCPEGYGCNNKYACPRNQMSDSKGNCKPCPEGKFCNGVQAITCGMKNGMEEVKAWYTGQRNHDVDLTKQFSQFNTNAMVLRDGSSTTGISVVSNYFWYFGVKVSAPCTYSEFNFKLTSNLHHLRTAYSQNGKSWTCASDYTDHGNNARKFSGCKGGNAAKYHGRHQTIRFTKKAMYFAFGFRDAGTVSELTGSCDGQTLGTPMHRGVKNNKCVRCPVGNACANGKSTPCGNKWADGDKCKPCPSSSICSDGISTPCRRTFGIESVRAWNSNQRTHDLDMNRKWSDLNTDANILLDGSTSTYLNVVSNYFWWFGVKVSQPCKAAQFSFTMTSNLHHLRTAYSMDGNLWTCQSEYRDTGNNLRKINGICKGGNAASYHSNTGKAIYFRNRAMYYSFGFRDAGRVSKLKMTCNGESVKFRTQGRYVAGGECKTCPAGNSCASGKPVKMKIKSVKAWNTGQKTHDRNLDRKYSQFNTNAASLIDSNTGGTGINVVSNYFWYFGVELSAECYSAKFTFLMTSNLHHLRTAYSQDGNTWNCASDYQDTGNNRRTFTGCKGGKAASYHSNKGKMIYFANAAKYYAFGSAMPAK